MAKSTNSTKKAVTNKNGIIKVPSGEKSSQPLLSGAAIHGGLVYIAGKGARGEKDIAKSTEIVLDSIEEELINAGSSMEKALKVTVFLHDLKDFQGMNRVYRGRFGENPPVRSTVACYGGIPGDSILEIDCIAAL